MQTSDSFWIPGNTPSSKNSRTWTGTYFVASALTQKWRRNTEEFWGNKKKKVFSVYEPEVIGNTQKGYISREVLVDKKYEWGGGQRVIFQYLALLSSYPLHVEFTFVRNSKHRFDYINLAQGVLDEMVEHDWIPDDSADYIVPYFREYIYDKQSPGVLIKILNKKPLHYGNQEKSS